MAAGVFIPVVRNAAGHENKKASFKTAPIVPEPKARLTVIGGRLVSGEKEPQGDGGADQREGEPPRKIEEYPKPAAL